MDDISPEFIERYQLLLERDPKSKVFAPLAEAYRKIGLQTRAYAICKSGLQYHPDFAGGHIAIAKVLIDLDETSKALEHLERATELAPENIMAHQVHAELRLKLKNYKDALRAYKMVLFLSPDNKKAQNAVKKLESLSAEDFSADIFADNFNNVESHSNLTTEPVQTSNFASLEQKKRLERFLSLIDVFIVRNDSEKAFEVYEEARQEFANHPELKKRLKIIRPQSQSELETLPPTPQRHQEATLTREKLLNEFLLRINKHRKDKNRY